MKQIVVIDDCRLNQAIARDILVSAGYEVNAAGTSAEANQYIFRQPQPDLILVDIEMPFLSGDKKVRILKAQAYTQGIPVIIMSQKSDAEMLKLQESSGADGYIVKPLRKPELLQVIKNFI
jgi:CheY-like chemotaxis protein